MSRQRPTLKLAGWEIATHLAATRSVQDDPSYPAYKCKCDWCSRWLRLYADVLPPDLLAQFERIGIQPEHPTDLYKYTSDDSADFVRVVFSIVGRVVKGPDVWIQDGILGRVRDYQELREKPFLSLAVYRSEDLNYSPPKDFAPATGDFLLADFRLAIPFATSAKIR